MEKLSRNELVACNGGCLFPFISGLIKKAIYIVFKFNRKIRRMA